MNSLARGGRRIIEAYAEHAFNPRPPIPAFSLLFSIGVGGAALLAVWLVQRLTGTYMTSILILAAIIVGLVLRPVLAIGVSCVMSLVADYFYLPPEGTVLDTLEGWENLVILCGIAYLVGQFMQVVRTMMAEQIRLQAARRSISDAVKLISHDLRNPLAGIKMRAQLIRNLQKSPEKQIEMAAKIEQSCVRLDNMIQGIIDASLAKTGTQGEVVFSDLLAIVRESIDESFVGSRNKIQLAADDSVLYGFWNRNTMKRALENLIENAKKHGSPQEPITVRLAKKDDHICLSVHNFGNEIPLEEQSRIFSKFTRGESAKDTAGWGLGLATVQDAAEVHGGSVGVKSEAERGTTFTLTLPLRPPEEDICGPTPNVLATRELTR